MAKQRRAYSEEFNWQKSCYETTIREQGADPRKLTIHADRGSSMKSKPLAFMLADLGVTKSHSRPHVFDPSGRLS